MTTNPTYQNALSLLEMFLHLKQFPKGISAINLKEEFFSNKDERTFNRIKKALKENLFDPQGDPVFFMERDGVRQIIRLHPKHFQTSDVMEWHLFGLMLSNVMLENIEGDIDTSPDIKGGVLQLRDLILSNLEKPNFESNEAGEVGGLKEDLLDKLKKKYFCKKVGQKLYGKDNDQTEIFNKMTEAVYKEKQIKISEYRGNKRDNWILSPYTILAYNEAFYIIAADKDSKIKFLAIDRIGQVEVIKDSKFEYPKSYSPAKLLEKGFGVGDSSDEVQELVLKFNSEVSYIIKERLWHTSQRINELENGDVILEMNVPVNYELKKFVLSFGSKVKVVKPDSLIQFIKKDREIKLY
ncbi:MAG: WYL domain-containing protein [Pseudomonadota bacterium]